MNRDPKQSEEHRDRLARKLAKTIQTLPTVDSVMYPKEYINSSTILADINQAKKRLESSIFFLTKIEKSLNMHKENKNEKD